MGYKIEDPSHSKEIENTEQNVFGDYNVALDPEIDVEALQTACNEIMASDEKLIYDEIDPNKSKDER